ncbi:MAG: outer membrane beta-barrel protein [Candidatus Aminicenantes bacterium]|nr:outer membrane beta-barrel protein [Candidatus Aminicenantes bacterium]
MTLLFRRKGAAKKTAALIAVVLFASLCVYAQDPTWPRFELNLNTGYGLSQFKGTSTYSDNWSYSSLEYVRENTPVGLKGENAFFFKGSFSYFFTPKFGVQLGGGLFSSNVPVTSDFSFDWKWKSGSTAYNRTRSWTSEGKLSTTPLFLNAVGKFRVKFLDIAVSAGPALYFNSFEADSQVGFGMTYFRYVYVYPYIYYVQGIEAFAIPIEIPQTSWTSFGANLGLGVDFKVSPTVAIGLEGRYFLVPKKSLRWEWSPGTYDGIFFDYLKDVEFEASDLEDYQEKMTGIDVKPSFFSISAGIKIFFGRK